MHRNLAQAAPFPEVPSALFCSPQLGAAKQTEGRSRCGFGAGAVLEVPRGAVGSSLAGFPVVQTGTALLQALVALSTVTSGR